MFRLRLKLIALAALFFLAVGARGQPIVSVILTNDPSLVSPSFLTIFGKQLLVTGVGTNNMQAIFAVPTNGGPATVIYGAYNPQQITIIGTNMFWIDPNSGPVTDTQILRAPTNGSGPVTAIYTGSNEGQPIFDGCGMTSDGHTLFASDYSFGQLFSLKPDGSSLNEVGSYQYTSSEQLTTIAFDHGLLYSAISGNSGTPSVTVIKTNGVGGFTNLFSGPPFVQLKGICVGNGTIYLSDPSAGNTIWQLPETGGSPTPYLSGGPFQRIQGLAFWNGTLYVADAGAGTIYKIIPPPISNLKITAQPKSQSVATGTNVTFSVTATDNQPLFYQWQFNGYDIALATNHSLTLSNVQPLSAGRYDVVVSDDTNRLASTNVTLSVGPVTNITSFTIPADAAGAVAVNATLNKVYISGGGSSGDQVVEINGSTFAQKKVGGGTHASVDITNNNYWAGTLYSGGAIARAGANDATLTNTSLGGCPVATEVDAVNRRVWITAQCGGGNDPVFAVDANTYALQAGPIGSGGVMGDLAVNPATGRAYINSSGISERVAPPDYSITYTAFADVRGVDPRANLLYAVGPDNSTLQILDGGPDPEVLLATVGLPLPISGVLGVNPALNRVYASSPGSGILLTLDGRTGTVLGALAFPNGLTPENVAVNSTNNRVYVLVQSSTTNFLYVLHDTGASSQLIDISSQPESQIVATNSDVIFNVGATGPGPLSYQWYFNNTNAVPSATNSTLSLVGVQTNSTGNYDVVVTFGAYSITSAVATLTVKPVLQPPTYQFSQANYPISESAGNATVAVINNGDEDGMVNYATMDVTALGGPQGTGTGDYTSSGGTLVISAHSTNNITVPIIDNHIHDPALLQFQVALSAPLPGILPAPPYATVTISQDDIGSETNSQLTVILPSAQPPQTGTLVVYLTPPEAGGQWRFSWDRVWRDSGTAATNLATGSYPILFRPEPGYLPYPPTTNVFVTNNSVTMETNQYYPTEPFGTNETGSLTVNINPSPLSGAGWRFVGESTWRSPGSTVTNLLPENYAVEFAPVTNYAQPPSQNLAVVGGINHQFTFTYVQSDSVAGALFPGAVPASSIGQTPYAFNGQLRTDAGFGSGVVVRNNIVLTAAHLVFNDATESYVSSAYWYPQEEIGTNDPEPLSARGFYILTGYAAQRTNDLSGTSYGVDVPSLNSENLDVAALYFQMPADNGGYAGYLASDNVPDPWLTKGYNIMLVGYPVDGSQYGKVITPGLMYATLPESHALKRDANEVYTTPYFLGFPGNDGGPVYVQYPSNSVYYPAAVYLGTGNSGGSAVSVVRAIDSSVLTLFNVAGRLGDAGATRMLPHTGGGTIRIVPFAAAAGATSIGYVQFQLGPRAALLAGAAWQVQGDAAYSDATNYTRALVLTNTVTVKFKPIPGWNLPASQSLVLSPGALDIIPALYTVTNPMLIADATHGISISGTTGTVYRLEGRTSLSTGSWQAISTNIILTNGLNPILPPLGANQPQTFYRAVWLP